MAFFGITLTDATQARLDEGAPVLQIDELKVANLEPGRPIKLIDRHAQTVACGIADPENGVLRLLSRGALRALDAAFFRRRVETAVALRRAAGVTAGDGAGAYRLVNGEGDGLSGFTVDIYGEYAVVCVPSRALLPFGRLIAEAAAAVTGLPAAVKGVVIKVRGKDPQDRTSKDEVIGEGPPEKLVVHELGVPFELHLLGSLNVGLFTDMREQRRGIGRFVAGRRVLNTFAYTGALSVAAARAGATAVTSVDLSSGVLSWAKENFRLSGLDPNDARFRFETSDVRRFMEKEKEKGVVYDTIIMDPPTVSAARASQWSMKKDYPDLIALAVSLLPATGGIVWASANTRRGPDILDHLREGMRRAGRTAAVLELAGLPPDYPTPPDWPEARYLEICQVYVGG